MLNVVESKKAHAFARTGLFAVGFVAFISLTIPSASVHNVIQGLNSQLGYTYLNDLTGAHYPLNEGKEFQVVYHIHNLLENVRLRIKANLSKSANQIQSISDIFSGARNV